MGEEIVCFMSLWLLELIMCSLLYCICQNSDNVFAICLFCMCFLFRLNLHQYLLTLISDVLKLGIVVILVQDEDVQLTNANQWVSCLVGGSHCHRILPLAFAVKFPGCHNYS